MYISSNLNYSVQNCPKSSPKHGIWQPDNIIIDDNIIA